MNSEMSESAKEYLLAKLVALDAKRVANTATSRELEYLNSIQYVLLMEL